MHGWWWCPSSLRWTTQIAGCPSPPMWTNRWQVLKYKNSTQYIYRCTFICPLCCIKLNLFHKKFQKSPPHIKLFFFSLTSSWRLRRESIELNWSTQGSWLMIKTTNTQWWSKQNVPKKIWRWLWLTMIVIGKNNTNLHISGFMHVFTSSPHQDIGWRLEIRNKNYFSSRILDFENWKDMVINTKNQLLWFDQILSSPFFF